MRAAVGAAVVVAMMAVTGCGSDGTDAADSMNSTTSTSTTSTSTSTTTTTPCTFAGGLGPQQNALAPVAQLLTDVTTATDGCTDTITFTFRASSAPAPSYLVEYADGPFTDSAGREVKPAGAAYLKVRFEPAWIADLDMEDAPLTYTGPRVLAPVGLHAVRGLALFDASEAVVGWIVGLDAERPFVVAGSPGRVVVTVG